MMTKFEMGYYDFMVEQDIATSEELNLARGLVSGSWEEVLNAVLFARTGYRDIHQYAGALFGDEVEVIAFL